jgi:hypothetical protein
MNADELLAAVAAVNSLEANGLIMLFAQLLGEKKTHTEDDGGTVTVARWRGKYYLLDYVQARPDGQKGDEG